MSLDLGAYDLNLLSPEERRELDLLLLAQPPDLLAGAFPQQRAFILDPSPMKAAFCTRRAAKSYSAGLALFAAALKTPRCSCLYVHLHRAEAKRTVWKDVFEELDRKHRLGCVFNLGELTVTFKNGSIIYVMGADADEKEKNKFLGQKYALVVIDEAASFGTDLEQLVYAVIRPGQVDYKTDPPQAGRGQMIMISMPSNITHGLFFDVSQGKRAGWSLHRWSTEENPYMAQQWKQEIDELERANPRVRDTSWFKQMYLGEYVVEEDAKIYRFRDDRNAAQALPTFRLGEWSRVLGVDLGYTDASAFVVCAYHPHCPDLYVVEAYKKTGMDVTAVAETIKRYQQRYEIDTVVIDGANKQAVREIQNRHGIALRPAEKTGKRDFQEIMNSDLALGSVKLLPAALGLREEWDQLVRDPKTGEEDSRCENHLADAGLYAWRFCYPYLATLLPKQHRPGSREWNDELAAGRPTPEEQAESLERELDESVARFRELELSEEQRWGGAPEDFQ